MKGITLSKYDAYLELPTEVKAQDNAHILAYLHSAPTCAEPTTSTSTSSPVGVEAGTSSLTSGVVTPIPEGCSEEVQLPLLTEDVTTVDSTTASRI